VKIEISDLSPEAIEQIYSKYELIIRDVQNTLLTITSTETDVEKIKSRLGDLSREITFGGSRILAIISNEKKRLNK